MSDNKKYYYLKLKDNFFDSDSIVILESMPDGYLYSNILLKLYLRSLKSDGKLLFNDRIPYNPTMLSQLTRHNVGVVEKALQIFSELDLIEILDNGAIYMLDIQNYIGNSSTEADRIRNYRNSIKQEKQSVQMLQQMYDKSTPEIEIEKEKEKEIEKEIEKREKRIDYQQIADMYNDTCVSFPKCTTLSDKRKKAIKARLNTYTVEDFKRLFELAEASNFLKGKNNRDWSATFDWLIQDNNMAKVLDGNYSQKGELNGTDKRYSETPTLGDVY